MSYEHLTDTFDQWAEAGRAESMAKGHGDVVRQVIDRMGIKAGDKILDLGCGNGWATRLLAQAAPDVEAVGVDISPSMIARARNLHHPSIRADYMVAPFEALGFSDGSFTRVFSMEAIYYALDLDQSLQEIFRVLKPGGSADVVIDYYQESPGTRLWRESVGVSMHYLSEAEWRQAFEKAGFRPVSTCHVIDRRGPGDPSRFTPTQWCPDWKTRTSIHQCGSLWISAQRLE